MAIFIFQYCNRILFLHALHAQYNSQELNEHESHSHRARARAKARARARARARASTQEYDSYLPKQQEDSAPLKF